jgi:hypothetical protein
LKCHCRHPPHVTKAKQILDKVSGRTLSAESKDPRKR